MASLGSAKLRRAGRLCSLRLSAWERSLKGPHSRHETGLRTSWAIAAMKLVIFGLSVSSSWGNGHATLWRGLCRELSGLGHTVLFFERDVPYYAAYRDLPEMPGLILYPSWSLIAGRAARVVSDADAMIVTSYCPDAVPASELETRGLRVFYDMDTPVTLDCISRGKRLFYIGERHLADFDLVLSFTGGDALGQLNNRLGARRVAPLYGSVDPGSHRPVPKREEYQADLSYMGTFAKDRRETSHRLFVEPAGCCPFRRFSVAGALYPEGTSWNSNVQFHGHLPPGEHPAFLCSSRMTLNVTRRPMAELGYCPSGRFFEAAACGVPVLSDIWKGIGDLFSPDKEILLASGPEDVVRSLELGEQEIGRIGRAARERALDQHTARHRARELEGLLNGAGSERA